MNIVEDIGIKVNGYFKVGSTYFKVENGCFVVLLMGVNIAN